VHMLRKAVIVLGLILLSLPSADAKKAEARNEDVPKGPSTPPPTVAAPTNTGSTPPKGTATQGGDGRGSVPSGGNAPSGGPNKPSGSVPGK
jgi:hypothetical protein